LLASVPELSTGELTLRLAAAAALGAAIGLERELREHEAGLRTHLLVSLGSATFTVASAYGFHAFLTGGGNVVRADPTRIAAQIVTGIGFIGAGTILRQGASVRGLTTAASLWLVAAVGLAAGAGYYTAAAIATAIALFALWPLRSAVRRSLDRFGTHEQRLRVELAPGQSPQPLLDLLEQKGVGVKAFDYDELRDRRIVTITTEQSPQEYVGDLSNVPNVIAVQWRRS
jgi:putative Mg2+ transporter-C (MgtC) family protein